MWYGFVLLSAVAMIVFILRIALMFDQNPFYYCRGETTVAWLVDFIVPYLVSVFVIEPFKIFILAVSKNLVPAPALALTPSEGIALEETQYNSND